jgi:tetratricopeptide (TPR) repeat protein
MLLPPEAAEHALTWTAIGRVEEALGQPAKAFAAYAQALALDQAIFGAEHPAVVADLRALASAQRAAGEVEAAEALEARADALTPETP